MPYSKINPDEMILRDHLAYDRTVLANERTFLAYLRTAIALLAAGGTLVKLFPSEQVMVSTGFFLLCTGVFAGIVGLWRLLSMRRRLSRVYAVFNEELEIESSAD